MSEHIHRLVGRNAEARLIANAFDKARAGLGSAVLIEGEPGIGKTALLADTAAVTGDHARFVLRARGVRSATDVAFGALHELLNPLTAYIDALPERQASALDVAFGRRTGPTPDRLVLGVAVLGLLEEACTQGTVVLLLDDLHWMDRTSVHALLFAAPRLVALRVLLVATSRTGGQVSDPADAFPTVVRLGPLDDVAAAQLLSDVAGHLPDRERSRVRRESYGNPLALLEFSGADAGATRSRTTDRMSARLERSFLDGVRLLPQDAQEALLLVAAGEGATVRELEEAVAAAGLGAADLATLEREGFVRRDGDRIVPRHPLVASAHYDAADPLRRRAAHDVLATAVRAPDRRALHRAAATVGLDESVAADLDRVAETALRHGAPAEAATAWQRAADLSPDPTHQANRLVEAAEAARRAGASDDASVLLRRAEPLAELSDARTQHRFARAEWMLSMTADHRGRGAAELVAFAGTRSEASERAEVLLWAAAKCYIHQEPDGVRELVASTVERAAQEHEDRDTAVLADVTLALVRTGRSLDDATVDRFLDRAQATDGVIINCLAFAAEEAGDMALSDRCWTAGARLFHDAERTSDEATALCGRASPRITAGHLRDGLADADRSARLSEELELPVVTGMALAEAARALARAGDRKAAHARLDALTRIPVAQGFARIVATAAWAAALIAADEGRHDDALAHLARTSVNRPVAMWSGADLVEAAIRSGDASPVLEWLDEAEQVAEVTGSSHLRLLVARSRGLLVVDEAEALEHLSSAVELGSPSTMPFDLAVARLHLGERLRRIRRIVDAREQLAQAVRLFDGVGARSWAARARTELRAAGGVADRDVARETADDLLTPQELLVSRMASTGRTNKQIADEVYLSHRTVAAHLSRAFTKLGISRRSQLVGVLAPADAPN
ncbi:AAA family ATPase [Curtobacterium sp. MCLR17_034]|uniref:AAA family ATPase n=1 Tax=Curtobacterium sp. MCLR17_034 TaxID=2175623 RepID=UPI000DAAB63B|nr:LuxR family transcriptional regulator [Curtobacterium sp. MCLR17_034]PZF13226.1 helix-turn-helix transcriptional regulator [Curtobacterium sp. MCLR17_034]